MRTSGCECCGRKNRQEETHVPGVYRCGYCEAIYGRCYLGQSYEFVTPRFTTDPNADSRARYFDFETIGSEGAGRRHGWYDPQTKLLTQTG